MQSTKECSLYSHPMIFIYLTKELVIQITTKAYEIGTYVSWDHQYTLTSDEMWTSGWTSEPKSESFSTSLRMGYTTIKVFTSTILSKFSSLYGIVMIFLIHLGKHLQPRNQPLR